MVLKCWNLYFRIKIGIEAVRVILRDNGLTSPVEAYRSTARNEQPE